MAENRGGHGPGGPGARGGYQKPKDAKRTMLRLMKYISGRKWLLVIVFLCVIASSIASIAGTYLIRPVLNELVGAGTLSDKLGYLAKMLAVMAAVFLFGAVCTYAQSAIMAQLAHRGTNKLRGELFDKMQDLPLSFYDKHPHGELMSRFSNDADYVQQMLEQSIVSVISSSLLFVGIVVVMLFTCAPLFLVTLLVLFGSLFAIRIVGGRSRKLYRQQQKALGEMNGNIQEMIEGLRVVKAFTHEDAAKEQFGELNDAYFDVAKDANFYGTAMMPIVANVMNIGYALTSIVGGLFAFGGMLDLGGLAVYLQYGRQISQPMSQVSQQMTSILSALAGAERIFEIIDMEPEVDEGVVTLVGAHKDANGAVTEDRESVHPHTWAWKVPRSSRLTLVPVAIEPDGSPIELGQAVREGGALRMLAPNVDSPDGIWVRAERDGSLTEVKDLAALASHGWAWKYPDSAGESTLHIVRGSVRNVPGEDYCLAELKGAVRLIDVCFSYVPEKPLIGDFNLSVEPGMRVAIVGPTGCGTTTLINLLMRFYDVDGGAVLVEGTDIRRVTRKSLRRNFGMVLQDTWLKAGTIYENIAMGKPDATREEVIAAAKASHAHGFISQLEHGYDTVIAEDGGALSQGQKQLLCIARVMLALPPMLILDEATSSIDTRTEMRIQEAFARLMRGRTSFIVAHRLSTIKNADVILVMRDGHIVEQGKHEELLAAGGFYATLYNSQFAS